MAATLGLVLDCDDPDKLAEFWSGRDRLRDARWCRELRAAGRRRRQATQVVATTSRRTEVGQEPHALRHRDSHRLPGGCTTRGARCATDRGSRLRSTYQSLGHYVSTLWPR